MGRALNLNSTGLYARLVGLYPAAYRRRYGVPMVQTFDDMLVAEPTRAGKLLIWAHALWDLPTSALKEHVTNGKGITMSRNMKILFASIVLVLLLANGASFWYGYLHARQTVGIERVSPTQLADAMQHDNFYSTYGSAALLFTGTIAGVQHKDGVAIATLKTDHAYVLECQFPSMPQPKAGDTVAVAAPGGSAERLPHGVLLHECVVD